MVVLPRRAKHIPVWPLTGNATSKCNLRHGLKVSPSHLAQKLAVISCSDWKLHHADKSPGELKGRWETDRELFSALTPRRAVVSSSSKHKGNQEFLRAGFPRQQVDAGWPVHSPSAAAGFCFSLGSAISCPCHMWWIICHAKLCFLHLPRSLISIVSWVQELCIKLATISRTSSLPCGRLWNPVVSTKINQHSSLHKLKYFQTFRVEEWSDQQDWFYIVQVTAPIQYWDQ